MILNSPSVSLAYDLFWSDILGDLAKIISGEQCTDRDQMFLQLKFFNSGCDEQYIKEHMHHGDSRAAVVISTEPRILIGNRQYV